MHTYMRSTNSDAFVSRVTSASQNEYTNNCRRPEMEARREGFDDCEIVNLIEHISTDKCAEAERQIRRE